MTEKLLGIESPPRKAHDDIKSIYGVDIPQNRGTIKQVVQIAQSQFHDALRREPGRAGRQSLSTGQLPGRTSSHLRLEHPDARWDRIGNLPDVCRR
jgi:hypothetical protein